jgi:exonuclease III
MSTFKITSINVRGLNESNKCRSVYQWFRNGKFDVAFIQETFSKSCDENIWKNEFGGRTILVHGTNHSCGIMVLFRNGFYIEIVDKFVSADNRTIILSCVLKGVNYYLICIYAPNNENSQVMYYQNLLKNMEDFGITAEHNIIIGGDFNVALTSKDKKGGSQILKNRTITKVNDIISYFSLQDIWRVKNREVQQFTWKQKRPLIQCRLDYFLISELLQDNINNVEIIPMVRSDHSAISLK